MVRALNENGRVRWKHFFFKKNLPQSGGETPEVFENEGVFELKSSIWVVDNSRTGVAGGKLVKDSEVWWSLTLLRKCEAGGLESRQTREWRDLAGREGRSEAMQILNFIQRATRIHWKVFIKGKKRPNLCFRKFSLPTMENWLQASKNRNGVTT